MLFNNYFKYFLFLFAFVFVLSFTFSALPSGCTYTSSTKLLDCNLYNKTVLDLNFDSSDFTLGLLIVNLKGSNKTPIINITNSTKNNILYKVYSISTKFDVNLIYNVDLNANVYGYYNSQYVFLRDINKKIIFNDVNLIGSSIGIYGKQINNLNISQYATLNLLNFDLNKIYVIKSIPSSTIYDLLLNGVSSNIQINDINKTLPGYLKSNKPLLLNNANISQLKNQDLNLMFGGTGTRTFSDINDVNFYLNYDSTITNINSGFKLNNARNVIINGFDINKVETLSSGPKTLFDINNAVNTKIKDFKLYSELKGYRDLNLTYFKITNSKDLNLINNVFNNANYVINSSNSNLFMLSNSFYNNYSIFNDIADTNFWAFNNFFFDFNQIYEFRSQDINKYILQYSKTIDENKSYGLPSNNCKALDYLNIYNTYDTNVKLYYFSNAQNKFIKDIFVPNCLGGNIFGDRTIKEYCTPNCFSDAFDYLADSGNPDYVNNTKYKMDSGLIDFVPLILKTTYVVQTQDDMLKFAVLILNKVESNNGFDMNIAIKPSDIARENSDLGNLFFDGNKVFRLNNLTITTSKGKKVIPLNLDINGIQFKVGCNTSKYTCVKADQIVQYFDIVVSNLNFKSSDLGIVTENDVEFNFNLNYDYNTYGNWVCTSLIEQYSVLGDSIINDIQNTWYCFGSRNIVLTQLLSAQGVKIKSVKTPDNSLYVIFGLAIVAIGFYVYRFKK